VRAFPLGFAPGCGDGGCNNCPFAIPLETATHITTLAAQIRDRMQKV